MFCDQIYGGITSFRITIAITYEPVSLSCIKAYSRSRTRKQYFVLMYYFCFLKRTILSCGYECLSWNVNLFERTWKFFHFKIASSADSCPRTPIWNHVDIWYVYLTMSTGHIRNRKCIQTTGTYRFSFLWMCTMSYRGAKLKRFR
jgi:hypothetical protein